MSTLIMIRSDAEDGFSSPAKEKAANRRNRSPILSPRRAKQLVGVSKIKLLFAFCAFSIAFFITSRLSSFMGWIPHHASSVSSPSRGGYTVLINTWKQNSVLKQAVAHYASCHGADTIHVAWSESEPPSEKLKTHLHKIVTLKSQKAHKPNFRFEINAKDGSNSRFKPIKDLKTDAIFSVDDDVIVPCPTLDFAFTVWQGAPSTMVGFVPRMHWLDKEQSNVAYYRYGGWWSVWWMGTYSMVLSKAAFFHRKYLDLYTYDMSPSIHNYISKERSCEDIAMSLVVANATVAPPIWVKGKIHEIGASGISSLRGHNSDNKNKCLNDLISLYGTLPLVSTNVKAVSSRNEWLW